MRNSSCQSVAWIWHAYPDVETGTVFCGNGASAQAWNMPVCSLTWMWLLALTQPLYSPSRCLWDNKATVSLTRARCSQGNFWLDTALVSFLGTQQFVLNLSKCVPSKYAFTGFWTYRGHHRGCLGLGSVTWTVLHRLEMAPCAASSFWSWI